MSTPTRPALLAPALAISVLIASGTFLVAKQTLLEFEPLALAMLRFGLAVIVLVPFTRLTRPRVRIAPEDRRRIWFLGLLAVPLNQGLFLYGIKWTSASHGALLYALTPAFVVMLGPLVGEAKPRRGEIAGIALAFAGVFVLLAQSGLAFDPASLRGDILILLAVVAWAAYLAFGRRLTHVYGPLVVTSEALRTGTILFLPVGLWALTRFDPATITPMGWGGLFFLAWLTSGVAYVTWFWGLRYLSAGTVAVLTNLQPVVTALMAWALLREPLPPAFGLSLLLVVAGVWITQRSAAARRGR